MQAIRNFVDAITYPFRMVMRLPSTVLSSPRRLLGMSLPARWAWAMFFFVLLIEVGYVIYHLFLAEHGQPGQFIIKQLWWLIPLLLAIPVVTYFCLKYWLEGVLSPHPDIEQDWNAALAKLREHSIDPGETPIFLVLGLPDSDAEMKFFASARISMPIREPSGPGEIHVRAGRDAIYVTCTNSSRLGMLLGGNDSFAEPAYESPGGSRPATETIQAGGSDSFGRDSGVAPSRATQPFGMGTVAGGQPPISPEDTVVERSGGQDEIRGTVMVGNPMGDAQPGRVSDDDSPSVRRRLDPGDAALASDKLAYVCGLIRRARDPLSPINGILVATPFLLLADGTPEEVNHLQSALRADLETIRGVTRVRCSVTHIVNGMEAESGFRELIRRIGADRASSQRFGKGFGLWNVPSHEQLGALVKHACGAFEDFSYMLFLENDGLSKRGNRHLYALLCRIRMNFEDRLTTLVQAAYSTDSNSSSIAKREPLLFSGCYFVADGQTPDRQAFLASVFRKAQQEEEELEWGSEARREESRMQTGVLVLACLIIFLLVSIGIMIVLHLRTQS